MNIQLSYLINWNHKLPIRKFSIKHQIKKIRIKQKIKNNKTYFKYLKTDEQLIFQLPLSLSLFSINDRLDLIYFHPRKTSNQFYFMIFQFAYKLFHSFNILIISYSLQHLIFIKTHQKIPHLTMIKQSPSLISTYPHQQTSQPCLNQANSLISKVSLPFSDQDFKHWCSGMTIEEIQKKFTVYYPQGVLYFRENVDKFYKNWVMDVEMLSIYGSGFKNYISSALEKFIQVLLFTSQREFLDSITFSQDCFLFPEKIYKLLTEVKNISEALKQNSTENSKYQTKCPQKQSHLDARFQIISQIIERIQQNLLTKMKLKFAIHPQLLHQSQQPPCNILEQFNYYWKYCSQEQRQSIWYLGYNEINKAVEKQLGYMKELNIQEIQEYISNYAVKIFKIGKQLSYKIFSWKLYQNNFGSIYYMELIFKELKARLRKEKYNRASKDSPKSKKQRINRIRRNSLDQSSNQTNQTDIIYEKGFEINLQEIVQAKLEKDIMNLADEINEEANQFYENRMLGYERLRHILACINIFPKLFGSCCAGLALRNSDVDVMIQENILNACFYGLKDTSAKISALFDYLKAYFANFEWISQVKVIGSATIPIIKLAIDNRIPFHHSDYDQETHINLNKSFENLGKVQIDLTVETTEPNRTHLGIISTKQTRQWLTQIPTLQTIAIILKHQLAQKQLNQAYYGGINTYTLLVMLVAYLKKQKLEKDQDLGRVFEKVVKYYGEEFDEEKIGIDMNCPTIFYAKQQENSKQISGLNPNNNRQLEVRDPLGNGRIMTRNSYQFKLIKQIFKQIYESCFVETRNRIQELCSIWNPKQNMYSEERLIEWVDIKMEENKFMGLWKKMDTKMLL